MKPDLILHIRKDIFDWLGGNMPQQRCKEMSENVDQRLTIFENFEITINFTHDNRVTLRLQTVTI